MTFKTDLILIDSLNRIKEEKNLKFQAAVYDLEIEKTKLLYKINSVLAKNEKTLNILASASGFFNENVVIVNVVPVVDGKIVTNFKISLDLKEEMVDVIDSEYLEQGLLQTSEDDGSEAYNIVLEASEIITGLLNG